MVACGDDEDDKKNKFKKNKYPKNIKVKTSNTQQQSNSAEELKPEIQILEDIKVGKTVTIDQINNTLNVLSNDPVKKSEVQKQVHETFNDVKINSQNGKYKLEINNKTCIDDIKKKFIKYSEFVHNVNKSGGNMKIDFEQLDISPEWIIDNIRNIHELSRNDIVAPISFARVGDDIFWGFGNQKIKLSELNTETLRMFIEILDRNPNLIDMSSANIGASKTDLLDLWENIKPYKYRCSTSVSDLMFMGKSVSLSDSMPYVPSIIYGFTHPNIEVKQDHILFDFKDIDTTLQFKISTLEDALTFHNKISQLGIRNLPQKIKLGLKDDGFFYFNDYKTFHSGALLLQEDDIIYDIARLIRWGIFEPVNIFSYFLNTPNDSVIKFGDYQLEKAFFANGEVQQERFKRVIQELQRMKLLNDNNKKLDRILFNTENGVTYISFPDLGKRFRFA